MNSLEFIFFFLLILFIVQCTMYVIYTGMNHAYESRVCLAYDSPISEVRLCCCWVNMLVWCRALTQDLAAS